MTTASNVLFHPPRTSGVLRRFGAFIRDFGSVVQAAREVERLLNYSDAELERRGLKRSDVVSQVFGAYLDRR